MVINMIKHRRYSMQVKIMLFFIALAMLLFITVGLLYFRSTKYAINTSKRNELSTLSKETANKIDRFLFERYGDIQVMAASPLLNNKGIGTGLKREYLDSVRSAYKTYDYIFITNSKGKIEILSGNMKGDHEYKKWIAAVLSGKLFVSDFTYNILEKSYSIYFASPIISSDGVIVGTVVERMKFDAISDIVKMVKIGKSGYAYLYEKDGSQIFNPSITRVNPIIDIKQNTNGTFNSGHNNVNFISAFSILKKYDTQKKIWFLVVEEPYREAFQVAENLRDYTILLILISVLVLFVLAVIIARIITKPIRKLVTDAQKIVEGSIKHSIEVESNDEIGSLTNSFNSLINSLNSTEAEIKKLEASVLRAKNLAALGTLSAGMAHEVRNPLTSIKGYAQYIKLENCNNDELIGDISIIINEVDRLDKIIERFLTFARPEELKVTSSNVNKLLYDVLKLIRKESRDDIIISENYGAVPLLNIDTDQMEQVFLNIILNSIQALAVGGELNIATFCDAKCDFVDIVISDNGIGIEPENMDMIFEPFFTTKEKGTGLGLSICSRIIENHRGFLEVSSKPGIKTEFIIKLPIK
jgi:two-component system, NtrC family, sensor kinase